MTFDAISGFKISSSSNRSNSCESSSKKTGPSHNLAPGIPSHKNAYNAKGRLDVFGGKRLLTLCDRRTDNTSHAFWSAKLSRMTEEGVPPDIAVNKMRDSTTV
jgi:hypothetical protein